MRDAARRALERAGDFEIVGEASSAAQIGPLVRRARPDVLLIDPCMGRAGAGLAALAAARKANPDVPVIALAREDDPEHVAAAARLGASGYILKSVSPDDLPVLIRTLLSGNVAFLGGEGSASGAGGDNVHGLSSRELEVLQSVAHGLTNQAIGRELWLSEQTVKFHLRNIYRKLSVANRTEAAQFAFRHGYAA